MYWVQVLDRLTREPFYAAYKRHVRQLLRPRSAGRYLDVGAGTGTDAAQLAVEARATVVAVDRSLTMLTTARGRGVSHIVAADAQRLPFPNGSFDGTWADRVLQHLANPEQALDELIRVTAPGGRVVLADPDYDTQVLDIADQQLARRVLRFRADHMLRHGTLAHRHVGLLAARGCTDTHIETHTLVVRDPQAVDNVMGLRNWAQIAHDQGVLSETAVEAWTSQLDQAIADGRFLYAVTFFITVAIMPGGRPTSDPTELSPQASGLGESGST
jgi:SAM-dependent methyltransferase